MFANWEEVFESFSEMKRFVQMLKITFVVNEQWVYSRENFLWALS